MIPTIPSLQSLSTRGLIVALGAEPRGGGTGDFAAGSADAGLASPHQDGGARHRLPLLEGDFPFLTLGLNPDDSSTFSGTRHILPAHPFSAVLYPLRIFGL